MCRKKLYCIGYSPKLNKFVLECVVPCSTWYNRYYEISEEEYNTFDSNPNKLNAFVDYLHKKNYQSNRFLFSDKKEENSKRQSELREIAINK